MTDQTWDQTPQQKAEPIYRRGYLQGLEDLCDSLIQEYRDRWEDYNVPIVLEVTARIKEKAK